MDFDSLNIRDFGTAAPYLAAIARVERLAGRWSALEGRAYGSDTAPGLIVRSTAASMRLGGWPEAEAEALAGVVEPRDAEPAPGLAASARGYADVLRLVMEHADELPFAESQVKYFHSLLLRYDPGAASHRRRYRAGPAPAEAGEAWGIGAAPPAGEAAAAAGRLVRGAHDALASGAAHPLLAIALFLRGFLALRPFADGNGRLARALAVYLLATYGYDHVRHVSLEEVLEERRDACAAALGGSRAGDASAWVLFFVGAVGDSIERALGAAGPEAERPRLHPRQMRLVEVMRERGAAKIGDLLELLPIPRATLKKDLKRLVDAGHLSTHGVRKGTVYHYEPHRKG